MDVEGAPTALPAAAFAAALRSLEVASPLAFPLRSRRALRLDLSAANPRLTGFDPSDTAAFSRWIDAQLEEAAADYACGGYDEDRAIYAMSAVFRDANGGETRSVHLGVDLWLAAGHAIHAVLPGRVHSTRDNAAFGDYGGTLVLEHRLPAAFGGERFHTLYGHLARASLAQSLPGMSVEAGALIGWLGTPQENGGWPPHLHFQIVRDMDGREGDHPGVCKRSERARWLERCPDPELLLRIEGGSAVGATPRADDLRSHF